MFLETALEECVRQQAYLLVPTIITQVGAEMVSVIPETIVKEIILCVAMVMGVIALQSVFLEFVLVEFVEYKPLPVGLVLLLYMILGVVITIVILVVVRQLILPASVIAAVIVFLLVGLVVKVFIILGVATVSVIMSVVKILHLVTVIAAMTVDNVEKLVQRITTAYRPVLIVVGEYVNQPQLLLLLPGLIQLLILKRLLPDYMVQ